MLDWEVYLDKANPEHKAIYDQLIPELVWIVTPDITHSEIARRWIDVAANIFIEKPLDSSLENVIELVNSLGTSKMLTRVYGLDHYRHYSMALRDLLPAIRELLGGALTKVDFYMTEPKHL